MVKILYSAKSMRHSKASKSPVMKDLLSNKRIAKTLDTKKEQRKFYEALREQAGGGGVTNKVFAKTLGKLKQDTNDAISPKEVGVIRREILGSSSGQYGKYINSGDYLESKNKNQTNAPVRSSDIKSDNEKINYNGSQTSVKPSMHLSSGSYLRNSERVNNMPAKGANKEPEKKRTIYDIIREKNKENKQ